MLSTSLGIFIKYDLTQILFYVRGGIGAQMKKHQPYTCFLEQVRESKVSHFDTICAAFDRTLSLI